VDCRCFRHRSFLGRMSQAQTQQQLKFRKCQNLGCDVMIAFQRKTDGSNGWSAVEKDSIGQIVIHRCMGKRRSSTLQQQKVATMVDGQLPQSNSNSEVIALLQQILRRLDYIQNKIPKDGSSISSSGGNK
jgi:hypothetical protein